MTLDDLQLKLQYQFRDPALLELALTHKSFATTNNERLEFLGDAVLGVEPVHEVRVDEDEHDEHVDRALLREPEAELEARPGDAHLVERLDEQDPAPVRDEEPDAEQHGEQAHVGAPVGETIGRHRGLAGTVSVRRA